MNNQNIQLQLEFTDIKVNQVIRLGDTRARDSEGRYVSSEGDDGDIVERLKVQLQVQRINYSIWLTNRDKEIEHLKQELKKYTE